VYGPLKGYKRPVYNLLHTNAKAALDAYPDLQIAISDRPMRLRGNFWERAFERITGLSDLFQSTIAEEDDRRPTMDVGLGIWNDNRARYYPMEYVIRSGKIIVDSFGDRTVLVYVEPVSGALAAIYADTASARWADERLRLDGGAVFAKGRLYDADGQQQSVERPMQLFTRWYGFALTFPGTEIYEERAQ
jgi:hypothetical protein